MIVKLQDFKQAQFVTMDTLSKLKAPEAVSVMRTSNNTVKCDEVFQTFQIMGAYTVIIAGNIL